jgi:hypothetical protein
VRLDETFRIWLSWVGIINYTIRIILVFDGFFNYHFESRQNMRNSLFVCGFQFSQCPKQLVEHWAEKVTPLYWGKPKQQGTKSWQALNRNGPCAIYF